jgi:tRNA A-37 threonylcarbamoyl transferase component Bud32
VEQRADPAEPGSELSGDSLRGAAPGDDRIAARARAAIEAQLFGAPLPDSGPPPAPSPRRLGRYVLGEKIGAGGMGVVYRAHDPELARDVAIKVLRADAADDAVASQRMLREARAMARVAHPNVIHVYDVGAADGQVFLAMELVFGRSLSRWLAEARRPRPELLAVFIAAGEGLAAAHRAGLVHRDFKPENVLVGDDGRVRVLDFGLARAAEHPHDEAIITSAASDAAPLDSLTKTGAILGTPRYMAPEQCEGRPADARSDQFSFCVALYEALFGVPPFAGRTVAEYFVNLRAGAVLPPPPIDDAPPELIAPLVQIVQRGLERAPERRFVDMGALLVELRAASDAPLAAPLAATPPPRRNSRAYVFLAGPAALVAIAVAVAISTSQPAETQPKGAPGRPPEGLLAPLERPTLAASPAPRGPRADAIADGATTGDRQGAAEPALIADDQRPVPEDTKTTAEDARPSASKLDWCYLDEDRYTLLLRASRRRATITLNDGRCMTCRPETRPSRVAGFQPRDCGHYQLCGPTTAEACR